jgi:hypothetical protein
VQRHPERGAYDLETIHAILDAGYLCHVGFVQDGQPFVVPTLYGRVGEKLYLHGSPLSRVMQSVEGLAPATNGPFQRKTCQEERAQVPQPPQPARHPQKVLCPCAPFDSQ